MPIEEREEEPAPELMRFKIISVAAENWGTYLGGESDIGVSLLPPAAGVLGGPPDAIVDAGNGARVMDWVRLRRSLSMLQQNMTAIDTLLMV
jgi:hypothetical protein